LNGLWAALPGGAFQSLLLVVHDAVVVNTIGVRPYALH
jgi:hypothetical protein